MCSHWPFIAYSTFTWNHSNIGKISPQNCLQFPSWILSFENKIPGGSEVKVSACNEGDLGSIPGSGRSPGGGNGSPLQYSCLENPMDGGAWRAIIHRVAESDTAKWLHFHFSLSPLLRNSSQLSSPPHLTSEQTLHNMHLALACYSDTREGLLWHTKALNCSRLSHLSVFLILNTTMENPFSDNNIFFQNNHSTLPCFFFH